MPISYLRFWRAFAAIALGTTFTVGQSACPPSGLTLSWTGTTRLGDAFSLSIAGSPSVSGYLAADLTPGPVQTSVGLVCLGMTPAMQLSPFALDALGNYSVGGILPPDPAFGGLSVFLQAGALDFAAPGGVAISNGMNRALRPPRLWILTPFAQTPTLCVYDVLTDTASAPITVAPFSAAAAMPALGLLVVGASTPGGNRLRGLDATGAIVVDVPIPSLPYTILVDGTFVSLGYGTAVQRFSFPSGAPAGPLITHPPQSISPYAFVLIPGTSSGLFATCLGIVPVDFATGVSQPLIPHGAAPGSSNGVGGILVHNGVAYCTLLGTGVFGTIPPFQITAIDLATQLPIVAGPLPLAGSLPTGMRAGVDGYGPAIHLSCGSSLLHIVPSTLQYTPITNSLTYNAMPSAGGSEYVWYGNGLVQSVDLFTFIASGAPLPSGAGPVLSIGGGHSNFVIGGSWGGGHNGVVTFPSSTLRKAYVITGTDANNPQNTIIRYGTDPLTSPQGVVVLPFSAQDIWTVVD